MFFIIDAILLLLVLILVCLDRYVWSTLAYIAAIAVGFMFLEPVNNFVLTSTLQHLGIIGGVYLLIGFGVSFVKWGFFMSDFGDWLKVQVAKFNDKLDAGYETELTDPIAISAEKRKHFLNFLKSQNGRAISLDSFGNDVGDSRQMDTVKASGIYDYEYKMTKAAESDETMVAAISPKAFSHKGLITFWVFHWPWVVLSIFVKNFILKLVQHFINLFSGVFHSIGKYFVRKATADLKL